MHMWNFTVFLKEQVVLYSKLILQKKKIFSQKIHKNKILRDGNVNIIES